MTQMQLTPSGREIAYDKTDGDGVGIVFLGGFMSDKEGTKAVALEAWAKAKGHPFLRFDYSGHGASSGAFTDGCIGDWAEDAQAIIEAVTTGPQVLVGSSMGGWISLLLAKRVPDRVAGLVTIAAAPDFTEDGFWADFDAGQRREVMDTGVTHVPSGYGDPYPITRRLIEDGREHLVLRDPLPLPFPVRSLIGTDDTSVDLATAMHLIDHAQGPDIRLTVVKGADHSFSTPECLRLIEKSVEKVIARL